MRELDTSAFATAETLLPVYQESIPHRHRLEPVPDAEMLHSLIQPRTTSDRRVVAAFDLSGTPAAFALVTSNRMAGGTEAVCRDLRVPADQRCRGYGSALLDAAKQLARQMGCVQLVMDLPITPEETDFPERHGGTLVYQHQRTVLVMADIDVDRYRALAAPAGPDGASDQYATVCWTDHCPDDLVQAFIDCRRYMHFEPPGSSVGERKRETLAQLRQLEDARIAYGQRRHAVAFLAPSGEMAAFVQAAVVVNSQTPLAPMGNLAVAMGHRGRGLARRVKAKLGLLMLEREPQIQLLDLWNDLQNKPAVHINQVLGWEVTGRSSAYEFEL